MPRESRFHSVCWEVGVRPEEVESLLAKMRIQSPNVTIQIFSASRTPNPMAVELIAAQTLTAAKSGSTLAERPELDLLLRLAGTRQIGEAFQRAGYRSRANRLFMVAASEGDGSGLARLRRRLAKERAFAEVPRAKLAKGDLDQVERAALLAARL